MLQPPLRNIDNKIEPYEEVNILNDHQLIRRIPHLWVVDNQDGSKRLSSMAFRPTSTQQDKYQGCSVDLKDFIEFDGEDVISHVSSPKHIGAIMFPVQTARESLLKVGYSPLADNKYHCEIWGIPDKGSLQRKIQKAILNSSVWLIEIPNVSLNFS